MRLVRRLAADAPVPVFAAVGGGARDAVDGLRADPRLRLVASPRAATVLLVGGSVPAGLRRPLAQVHDQLPHPRASVWWAGDRTAGVRTLLPQATPVASTTTEADVTETLVRIHRELLLETRASEQGLLPDAPPAPWRGVGPHGQGGEGMMGGQPYGRPMAMTDDDRDGLALDRLELRLGPFLDGFPPGLALDVALQGDVFVDARVATNPFGRRDEAVGSAVRSRPAALATRRLHQTGRLLRVSGLAAWARRIAQLAIEPDANAIRRLRTWFQRTGALRGALAGVATIGSGPDAGDALARLHGWLDEAEAASSAATAADSGAQAHAERLRSLGERLVGLEWGAAMIMIASLDLDLEAAARSTARHA